MTGKRIYGLDILRAVAIIFVVFPHGSLFLHSNVTFIVTKYALDGVSLFFVLSGFLIGGILIRTITRVDFNLYQLKHFWMRRWFRTLPAYFVTILIVLAGLFFTHQSPTIINVLKHLTFTQALYDNSGTFYHEGWSLSIEEWFYLTFPAALFFAISVLKINWKTAFIFLAIATIILSGVARYIRMQQLNLSDINIWHNNIRMATYLRLDSLMFGLLGAYLEHFNYKVWRYQNLWFWSGIGLFLLIIFSPSMKMSFYFAFPAECLATLLLLPKLSLIKTGRGVTFKVLTFISTISYSMYLLNLTPFTLFVWPILQKSLMAYYGWNIYYFIIFSVFVVWTFGAAYLMYRFIEKPFIDLRDNPCFTSKQPSISKPH